MTIRLTCSNCDGNSFAYPFQLTSEAVVHCEDCGTAAGTIGEISEKIMGQIAPAPSQMPAST